MIQLAAGWALVILLLLLAVGDPVLRSTFVFALFMLLVMFALRLWMHLRSPAMSLWLDAFLSFVFLVPGVVLLSSVLQMLFFYVDAWNDLLDPRVILVGINIIVILPFVVFSFLALIEALRELHRTRRQQS